MRIAPRSAQRTGRLGRSASTSKFAATASLFTADFMFQLTAVERSSLRSQFATLKPERGQHQRQVVAAGLKRNAERLRVRVNSCIRVGSNHGAIA